MRRHRSTRTSRSLLAVALGVAALAAACSSADETGGGGGGDRGDCIGVDVAVSSEKVDLLGDLADDFDDSGATVDGRCIDVEIQKVASGVATQQLADGWDTATDGPRPVIWSPASSAWGQILDQRLGAAGKPPMATDPVSFMNTPLVIAMPEPMATALGWPDKPIGWSDILALSRSQNGWADLGHPEWGRFKLGKTNPNYSTSGLHALIAQTYAATGKTSGLSSEDLQNPTVQQYGTDIESAVVHYGDITMTFLNNWFRADRRGTALNYASAVAIEEKSVIDYNAGNPDGVLDQGEEPREPRTKLVAIYPTEGTLYSDNPLYVLDADWVSSQQRQAAEQFQQFVLEPANQEKVLEFGFRPGNPDVAVADPISTDSGVDPNQPQTLLEVPSGAVMDQLLQTWAQQRKGARVMLVIDVSGSMGDPADPDDPSGPTKLDLAKQAVVQGLDQFKPEDLVGVRVFTSGIDGGDASYQDLAPVAPIGPNRERIKNQVDGLAPLNGTPLYEVTQESYDQMLQGYDASLINAVIVLTDGRNDDGDASDDRKQLDALLADVKDSNDGENSRPVRIFTIAYGGDTNPGELKRIAEASNATAYTATDATTIDDVFAAVVSNF
ncbi:extracellular solute-binding protein [Dermatobacter hominis]|uniref:extracellular solute-binding protein n=1 Tax=Dermatobacter hominis TaxID=2884263 RepID=UPI001D0FB0EE|nr:extracellular solute-binding protein [Dermatobacter hominis]UDY35733.1 substrate-binding and VWA domain-containing protein [Dermatobacter hominis]